MNASRFLVCSVLLSSLTGLAHADAPVPNAATPPVAVQPTAYQPPEGAKALLGTIPLEKATVIDKEFGGGKKLLKLPNGVLYIDADLDTDADGSPRAVQIDKWGQAQTSFSYPKMTGQEQYVDAEKVPFFVLPGGFYAEHGIKLGDLGVIIYNDKIVYGFFADTGPKKKIGEASVKAVEMLGHNPWNKAHTQIVSGIDRDVVMLVFPGSALPDLTPGNVVPRVDAKAKELFKALGGVAK